MIWQIRFYLLKKSLQQPKINWKETPNHDKYIIVSNFKNFSDTTFDERLKQRKLATKDDIAAFDKKLRKVSNKVALNITKTFFVKKKVSKMLTVGYDFSYNKCFLRVIMVTTFFIFWAMLNSLTLYNNKNNC